MLTKPEKKEQEKWPNSKFAKLVSSKTGNNLRKLNPQWRIKFNDLEDQHSVRA